MKLKSYLSVLLCVSLSACSFNTSTLPSHITPTAPTVLVDGIQQIKHNGYDIFYIANDNDLKTTLSLLDAPITNYIASWNETLAALNSDTESTIDPLLFNTLRLMQTITSANDSITIFDDLTHLSLDPINQTITLNKPYQLNLSSNMNNVINLTLIKETLKDSDMFQFAISDASSFHALIPASYQYYTYAISTKANGLSFQFNQAYSIQSFNVDSDTIHCLTLVSENPIAIELIGSLINDLTFDQLKIVIEAIESICPIYLIVTLPLDSKIALDIKFKNDEYAYTWDKALDHQIIPG